MLKIIFGISYRQSDRDSKQWKDENNMWIVAGLESVQEWTRYYCWHRTPGWESKAGDRCSSHSKGIHVLQGVSGVWLAWLDLVDNQWNHQFDLALNGCLTLELPWKKNKSINRTRNLQMSHQLNQHDELVSCQMGRQTEPAEWAAGSEELCWCIQ